MNLLAKTSFRNVGLAIAPPDPKNPFHIAKGSLFTIGTGATFAELTRAEKLLVTQLNFCDRLCEPSEANIAATKRELAVEQAREKRDPGTRPLFDTTKLHHFR